MHVLRDQVVGHAAVDEEWRKLLLVTLAALQRLAQDVLLGYTWKGYGVFEDVYPKCGVELLHLLQRLQEWGNVKVVVVLQPVAEGSHTTLAEDALAVVVLLGREYVSNQSINQSIFI